MSEGTWHGRIIYRTKASPKWENQPWRSDHFSRAPSLLIREIKDVENRKSRRHLDLAAWRNGLIEKSSEPRPALRQQDATAILTALQDDEEEIESVRAASIRRKCTYPVDYTVEDPWQILLPHLSNIKELALRLELLVESGCVSARRMGALLDETCQLIAILTTISKKAKS
jgi:hypothetical protein